MSTLPKFVSLRDYVSRLDDVSFWWPCVDEILNRHCLANVGLEPVAGFNATYPTFIYGDVVIKLFGYCKSWGQSYSAERAALGLVATDPKIIAPNLLGYGYLYCDTDESWPYLITTRAPGVASIHVELSRQQKLVLAADLGAQIRHIHALSPLVDVSTDADWSELNVATAAKCSSLPPHLIAQIDDYLARIESIESSDCVFTHGDLCDQHVFVDNGRLSSIIDWGDAMVTDRHYELIQVYRSMFDCDKEQFQIFLDTSNWSIRKDFPRQVLCQALRRQAIGLAQHNGMDVFEPIAKMLPLHDIETLDQLATELFAL